MADFRSEQRFSVPASYLDHGLVSAMGVPLVDRGQIIGVLTVRSCQPERFGAEERHFLESLSNLLAASLQRSQSEEALNHAQRMESVGQLTGGIAHDFNNMLTGIIGSLDLMRRRIAANRLDELDRYMDAATMSAERAAALTQRLLAFSRRQSLDPQPLGALDQLVHEPGEAHRPTCRRSRRSTPWISRISQPRSRLASRGPKASGRISLVVTMVQWKYKFRVWTCLIRIRVQSQRLSVHGGKMIARKTWPGHTTKRNLSCSKVLL